jgi:membrane protein
MTMPLMKRWHVKQWPEFATSLAKKMNTDDCQGLAGEMVYNMIFSLIPMLLFLTSLAGLMGAQKEVYRLVIDLIHRLAPVHTVAMLIDIINTIKEGSSTQLTIIGLLGALWSASRTSEVVVKGLQRAFGLATHKFPFWYSYLLSMALIVALGLIAVAATWLLVAGEHLADQLSPTSALDLTIVVRLFRWLIIIGGLHGITTLIYCLILYPRLHRLAWKPAMTGSGFFVTAWLFFSFVFNFYVDAMVSFNPVYGAMGALVVLLTWLYYSSLTFFIGGEIIALKHLDKAAA